MRDYSDYLDFILSEIILGPVVSHVTLVNTYISQTHIDCLPIAHCMGKEVIMGTYPWQLIVSFSNLFKQYAFMKQNSWNSK